MIPDHVYKKCIVGRCCIHFNDLSVSKEINLWLSIGGYHWFIPKKKKKVSTAFRKVVRAKMEYPMLFLYLKGIKLYKFGLLWFDQIKMDSALYLIIKFMVVIFYSKFLSIVKKDSQNFDLWFLLLWCIILIKKIASFCFNLYPQFHTQNIWNYILEFVKLFFARASGSYKTSVLAIGNRQNFYKMQTWLFI